MAQLQSRFRWTSWVAVLSGHLGIVACRTERAPEPRDPSAVGPSEEIDERVASLRGLSIERPIERALIDRDQYRARLIEDIEDTSPAEHAAYEAALKRIGMYPMDYDPKAGAIDLYSDAVYGFYDWSERRLYVIDSTEASSNHRDAVLAHEIIHALQDQHFDLRSFGKSMKHESDATLARRALVEGDAKALTWEFLYQPWDVWADSDVQAYLVADDLTSRSYSNWTAVPRILVEGFNFPYVAGVSFVAHMRQHHPWSRIDEIYARPPLSTEHILHPIKYEAYELPDRIEAKLPPMLTDHFRLFDDCFGEFGMALFLRQHGVERRTADMAAQGWGGDRLVVYAPRGHTGDVAGTIGAWYSIWDHPDDAIEFFDALAQALPNMCSGQAVRTDTTWVCESAGEVTYAAERRGDAVVISFAAPSDRATSLHDEIWSTWTATRR